jgi:predicted metalloendopeptidase
MHRAFTSLLTALFIALAGTAGAQVATRPKSPSSTAPETPAQVNGVVANMPEFSKAFGCKAGDAMVREPACRVW